MGSVRKLLLPAAFVVSIATVLGSPRLADGATNKAFWDVERQTIDGFGGSCGFIHLAFRGMDTTKMQEIAELLFSPTKGIGLSILRREVSSWLQSSDTSKFDILKDTWIGDDVWLVKEAMKNNKIKVNACPFSPPPWIKTNNSTTNGGSVKPEWYPFYAEYLTKFIEENKRVLGIETYALSIQNEPTFSPGYQSCIWSAEQLVTFATQNLAPLFKQRNITTKIMCSDDAGWEGKVGRNYFLNDQAAAVTDIYSAHGYVAQGTMKRYDRPVKLGKQLWQTEMSMLCPGFDTTINCGLKYAQHIQRSIVAARVNAWLFWALVDPRKNHHETMIYCDTLKNRYYVPKNLWVFGQYSRFVTPGSVRLQTLNDDQAGIYTTAYKDSSRSKVVVVVINDTTMQMPYTFTVDSGSLSTVQVHRTSVSENLLRVGDITPQNSTFSTTLPPKSITTYVASVSRNSTSKQLNWTRKTVIEAESFAGAQGIAKVMNNSTVSGWKRGNYARYSNVNLTATTAFFIRASCRDSDMGKRLTVHLDSLKGPAIATFPLMTTNDTTYIEWQGVSVSGVSGTHELFFTMDDSASLYLDCFALGTSEAVGTRYIAAPAMAKGGIVVQSIGSGIVRLRLPYPPGNSASIRVHDLSGRQVFSTRCDGPVMDMKRPRAGTYLVSLTSSGVISRSEIVIP